MQTPLCSLLISFVFRLLDRGCLCFAMNDAEAYLRRGKKIQSQKFGRGGVARDDGSACENGEAEKAARSGVVIMKIDDAHREARQQLPMKKKKTPAVKRGRDDSSSDGDEAKPGKSLVDTPQEEPELANVASPSSPLPQVEGVAQRISLLSKWFPPALQESKVDAAVAPGVDFVEATVERVSRARDYVLALRYGIEDVESLLKKTCETQKKLWEDVAQDEVGTGKQMGKDGRKRQYWELAGNTVATLVRESGAGPFKEALSEFADEVPTTSSGVATAVRAVAHRRRCLRVPLEYSPKGWHEVLDRRGPEAGYAPRLSDILWLSVASATAMFTVVTQRLLRGARTLAEMKNEALAAEDAVTPQPARSDSDAEDGPRFYDNTGAENDWEDSNTAHHSQEVAKCIWLAESSAGFHSALSTEEKSALAFLRFLMPTSEQCAAAQGGRTSTGFGVWLYAAFTTLDTPLDPDTARLAHDLFRTCCRHLRTLGAWKGVRGNERDTLLKEFPSRQSGVKATYASLEEVAREDVLALYTVVVVLSRFFRQNQDHFIPL